MLKFVGETRMGETKSHNRTFIPIMALAETRTKSPYLPSKVALPQLFTSFWINLRASSKRQTDVLEVTTFLHASDSLFGSRLMFKQSYLTWSDDILSFNEMATEKSENPEIRCVNNSRWGGGAALFCLVFCFYVNDWTISGLQSSFFDTATWR